ncbi:MAG: metal ABC transporter ATP-binding protein [Phycisphaerales bacterium]|nr:metal ABC transporter ATP-binding protein [Phycisphaerales bacterium]
MPATPARQPATHPAPRDTSGDRAIDIRDVSFAYPLPPDAPATYRPALERVSLSVREGERLGIVGPNGAGKSTLLKLILGMLEPSSGGVRVLGEEPREARARGLIAYVPQKSDASTQFPLCVRQVVEMPLVARLPAWRGLGREDRERAMHALELVDMRGFAERHIAALSGGQMQRVLIARAIVTRPRVLLLDEPTAGVDVAGQRRFSELLQRVHAELGLTLVIVSHNLRAVAAGCDHIACLHRTLHSHVTPEGLTPQVLAEVFSHEIEGIFGDVHVDAHPASACGHDHGTHHAHDHSCAHDHVHADERMKRTDTKGGS